MKVLLNVDRALLDRLLAGWTDVQGIRLQEARDGSFDLIGTTDLTLARRDEARGRMVAFGDLKAAA